MISWQALQEFLNIILSVHGETLDVKVNWPLRVPLSDAACWPLYMVGIRVDVAPLLHAILQTDDHSLFGQHAFLRDAHVIMKAPRCCTLWFTVQCPTIVFWPMVRSASSLRCGLTFTHGPPIWTIATSSAQES